jgi:hypothetical protein
MMHGPINVKSPNNTSKWQMGFNSAFKGLIYERFKLERVGISNQSLVYIYPIQPKLTQIFYLPPFNSVVKKIFLGRKYIGGAFAPSPQVTPMRSSTSLVQSSHMCYHTAC